jgi:hypothetical protein
LSAYVFGLFAHIFAAMAAFAASMMLHGHMMRMARAGTPREARAAADSVTRMGKKMPIFVFLLLLTGSQLASKRWPWNAAWIEIGIIGLIVMLITGVAILRPRLALVQQRLGDGDGVLSADAAAAVRDPVLWTFSQIQPAIAIGIMFCMVAKQGMGFSLTAMAVFIVLGVVSAIPFWRRPAAARMAQTA